MKFPKRLRALKRPGGNPVIHDRPIMDWRETMVEACPHNLCGDIEAISGYYDFAFHGLESAVPSDDWYATRESEYE